MLEVLVDVLTRHEEGAALAALAHGDVLLEVELLEAPVHELAVVAVHVDQVLCEQGGLGAARRRLDLQLTIPAIRVRLGDDGLDDLRGLLFQLRLQLGHLLLSHLFDLRVGLLVQLLAVPDRCK